MECLLLKYLGNNRLCYNGITWNRYLLTFAWKENRCWKDWNMNRHSNSHHISKYSTQKQKLCYWVLTHAAKVKCIYIYNGELQKVFGLKPGAKGLIRKLNIDCQELNITIDMILAKSIRMLLILVLWNNEKDIGIMGHNSQWCADHFE